MADWWTGKPWRMIQTNLREIDMLDIGARRVVADLQAFKATALLINAAGIIASYPTDLPDHYQSPFLTGSSLEEIIAECHAAGIRVLARTDFSKIRRPIYERHPDWAYRTPAGAIVDYNGDVHACINGGYQQEYALEILREMLTRLAFDGVFFNMGGYQVRDYSGNYHGICHCANCQRRFLERTGLQLPARETLDDPVYRRYTLFKRETTREHQAKVEAALRALRPELCIANYLDARRGFIRQECNTAVDRPLPHWQYSGSSNTKWAVTSYPEMVSSVTTVDFIDIPYRHVAVSPHQQRLRLAQCLANGGALDWYLIGRLDNHEDRSGYAPVREMFHYHAAHEEAYRDLTSAASVVLLTGPDANGAEFQGWFRMLLENHFLFDTLVVERALDLPLERYRAVVVPDYQPIGDDLAARLDDYVARGGTLIGVGRSGLRDGALEPRTTPALGSLGLRGASVIAEGMRSAYLRIDDRAPYPRLPETRLLYLDGLYIYGDYEEDVERRLRLIPPHMYGPPERCYYTLVTEHPGYTLRRYGEGLAIYIPWQPGSLFQRQGHTNTSAFVADLLEHVAGVAPVGGNLSPMVEVTLMRQGAAEAARPTYLLHLVNGSGHFGVTFYAPVEMHDLEVLVPGLQGAYQATSLVTGAAYACESTPDGLAIRVPRLGQLEAIRLLPQ